MRTVKRNKSQRANGRGYRQGLKGHTKESCPFHDLEQRGEWMAGWRVGHASYVAGYITPIQI